MKKNKTVYKRRDNIAGYAMLAPWLFGFVLMWFLPMLISVYYSFTDFNLLNDAKVIGFSNYIRIFTTDETFWQALKVTFVYTVFLVPVSYTHLDVSKRQTRNCSCTRMTI